MTTCRLFYDNFHVSSRYISHSALGAAIPEESFKATKVCTETGDLETVNLTPSEILNQTSILPRDLVSLALSTRHDRSRTKRRSNLLMHNTMRHPPAAILPRNDCILLSFGSIRAVAGRENVYIFDTHNQVTRSFAEHLSQVYRQRAANHAIREKYRQQQKLVEEEENNGNLHGSIFNQDNSNSDGGFRIPTIETKNATHPIFSKHVQHYYQDDDDEPPELIFLETILADSVESSTRRIRIFEPIVDDLLGQIATDDDFSNAVLHQMAPLKDQLQSFDMFVTQAYECLTQLLNDDEEMLKLLLTEQEEARRNNTLVDPENHQRVELLLGVYAQQFRSVQQEANFLLSRIRSKQEFIELELDLYRNRLIRMDVDLAIMGVSVGITTAIAGWFGMNLVSGMEESQTAFSTVIVLSSISAGCIGVYFSRLVSGSAIQRRAQERIEKIRTMTQALSDMTALDHCVAKIIKSGKKMDREEFKRELGKARHSQQVTDAEVDLLFKVLNSHEDEYLDHDDFADASDASIRKKTFY